MATKSIEVIATTISGSIKDWGKVKRIIPLFKERGRDDVALHAADSHAEARARTRDLIAGGARTIISAGGSGTFNSVLEGCIDSGVPLCEIVLGFLRKGSADLIGKTLDMPDEIEEAITVFTESLAAERTLPCDVIAAIGGGESEGPRHFVGYGGAGIFGRVPHYTENRFIKYYKGVLSQLFGDMGPFFVGASLSVIETSLKGLVRRKPEWKIEVDGVERSPTRYQAMIIVNGDLGKDLPFARDVPLGSGDFHMFALRDIGLRRLPGQFKHAWDASIMNDPQRWGFEPYRVDESLKLSPSGGGSFPLNVDGSTLLCTGSARFRIVDRINLISRA
jgi:diacylglycerol kinase family enzyme